MNRTIAVALVLSSCSPAWSVDVTFEEAQAAYMQNMQALKAFRCRIQQETSLTDDYFDVLQQRIARIELALPKLLLGKNRDLAEREFARLKELSTAKQVYPLRSEAMMAIGSRIIQIAVPSTGPAPKLPATSQLDLLEECYHSIVLCWSRSQEPHSWMWQGAGGRNDGVLYATISSRRPQDILGFPVLPVGARARTFFEQNRLSPFDAFFDDSYTETRVIGRDQLDGQPVIVIERANEKSIVQASLAIDRNFFPVHIKWGSGGTVLDVTSFHETPLGAFYPSRWTIQRDGADDRSAEVRNSERPGSVRYIRSIETWTVDEFQSDQREPPLFSEIGLPVGTYCLDEDNSVYFTVSESKEAVDTVPEPGQQNPEDDEQNATVDGQISEVDELATRTDDIDWMFWFNVIAIVGIITLFAIRRMRKGAEK